MKNNRSNSFNCFAYLEYYIRKNLRDIKQKISIKIKSNKELPNNLCRSSKRLKKAGVESTAKKASKSGVKSPSKSLKDSKKPSTIKSSKGKSVTPKSSEVSRSLKQQNSSSKKNSKSPSTAKQQKPVAKEKVEEVGKDGLKARVTESGTNQKTITSGDDIYVGKHVKKDFDGKFYDGVVLKFDKKTQYYKV